MNGTDVICFTNFRNGYDHRILEFKIRWNISNLIPKLLLKPFSGKNCLSVSLTAQRINEIHFQLKVIEAQ